MRSRVAWLIGHAGLLALFRRLKPRPGALDSAGDPAAELRRKLDATREETPAEGPLPPPTDDLEVRRRRVHDAGRAAVDEMGGAAPGD